MKKIVASVFVLFFLFSSCSNSTSQTETTNSTENKQAPVIAPIGEGATVITPADYQKMINVTPIVLVDFSATWCGPCKRLAPILDELVNDMPGKFTLVKSDVDRDNDLAVSNNITAMPTLMLYKNGKLVWRNEGLVPKGEIAARIEAAEKD